MRRDWWRCFWTYSKSPVLLSCGMGLYWNKNGFRFQKRRWCWWRRCWRRFVLVASLRCWWPILYIAKSHQHNDFPKITITAYIFSSWSGIGLFKNLQSGSHPSFKSHTKRFSFGTVAITWLLCLNQFYCVHFEPLGGFWRIENC